MATISINFDKIKHDDKIAVAIKESLNEGIRRFNKTIFNKKSTADIPNNIKQYCTHMILPAAIQNALGKNYFYSQRIHPPYAVGKSSGMAMA